MARKTRALLVMLSVIGLQLIAIPAASAASTCVTSGTTYTVSVCLSTPSGKSVSGDAAVTITVTITGSPTSVARVNTYLDGQWLLEDVAAPYTFVIPTSKFVDGNHVLSAEATLRNGFLTPQTSTTLNFSNGVTQPPVNNNTFTPRTGTKPAAGAPLVFAATGDGAGGRTEADDVVSLVKSWNPNLFGYLGDVYAKGTPTEFYNWYGHAGSKWNALYNITNPVTGNHEYENGVNGGYEDYWNNVPDYYSYDAGGWHFIALNSNSQGTNNVALGSPQYNWLAADLAANRSQCTLAYFHHPVVSSGPQNDTPTMNDIWKLLVDGGTDIVLTGHDHQYQRFVPLNRDLQPSASGTTEFVAGGGGHGIQSLVESDPRVAAYADTPPNAFGALKLQLNSGGANFAYVNTAGATLDSGAIGCGGTDSKPPTNPTGVSATAQSHYQAAIGWSASTDNVGVAGYTIVRNGTPLVDVASSPTSYLDATAVPGTAYTYGVQAFDLAGNRSAVVNAPSITMPARPATITYGAAADAYTNQGSPTVNYGAATTLRTDNSPILRSYLRFDVAGLGGPPSSAKLRIYTSSSQSAGFSASITSNNWTEPTINFSNAPAPGASIGQSGSVTKGTWVEVPLATSAFSAGNGTYSVALDGLSSTTLSMASREDTTGHAPQLVLGSGADSSPPSNPTGVTATAQSYSQVTVGWTPSTDNVGVAGYTIVRNGTPLVAVASSATSYVDATAVGGTTYTYGVQAFDGAGNRSAVVNAPSITTPVAPTTVTLNSAADAYVNEGSPTTNYGAATTLRTDNSPILRSYLRFDVAGLSSTPTAATLHVYANSSQANGFRASIAANGWTESTINFSNAPAPGTPIGQSGSVTGGTWVDVALPASAFSAGNGTYTLALDGLASTTLSMASREDTAGHVPQLVISTQSGGGGTNAAPSAGPVSVSATEDGGSFPWTPVVTDPNGPAGLTCSIATAPAHGTATVAPNCSSGTYTPALNFNGSDPFVYRVSDGSLTADGTVSTTVAAVNDAPVAATATVSTTTGTPVTVALSASDVDGTCPLTLSVSTGPSHGSLGSISPIGCSGGMATASVVYTPTAGYTGPDAFAVVANDGTISSAAAQISVTVAAAQTSFAVTASEDAYVVSTSPSTNYGSSTQLKVDNSPDTRSYLRFQVTGVSGSVVSATLHLFVSGNNSGGFEVHSGSAGWTEGTITYGNAPAAGVLLGSSGAVTTGTWIDVTVTAAVTGNGEVDLVLVPVNGTNLPFGSRESANPPQLLIQTG